MLENLHRDEATVPMVAERMRGLHRYLDAASGVLIAGRPARGGGRRRLHAARGHALSFATWRSLAVAQELGDAQAAELMCRLVGAAERTSGGR